MEELRELHYEQLHKMHFSQNIIRMVKCRRIKREGLGRRREIAMEI